MNTNTTICELILTNRGQTKINVDGYLMVKDKNRSNSYYWCCERRDTLKCNGRATTRLIDDNIIFEIPLTIIMQQKRVESAL